MLLEYLSIQKAAVMRDTHMRRHVQYTRYSVSHTVAHIAHILKWLRVKSQMCR